MTRKLTWTVTRKVPQRNRTAKRHIQDVAQCRKAKIKKQKRWYHRCDEGRDCTRWNYKETSFPTVTATEEFQSFDMIHALHTNRVIHLGYDTVDISYQSMITRLRSKSQIAGWGKASVYTVGIAAESQSVNLMPKTNGGLGDSDVSFNRLADYIWG